MEIAIVDSSARSERETWHSFKQTPQESHGEVKMNYLRNIEIESHASSGSVHLLTDGETSGIAIDVIDGNVMVNMSEFHEFCKREDVSLSREERDSLLESIETEVAATV